ncbi:hypothetical protein [Desulfobulbus alkaliphilus]|uniref:hypothetical protein n=1 Tax=Desulfobulbus alkaliphilus TaxID=869814 RepID=UPI001964C171|nr:hypothetical protein [Desulfobulbus alkaliphilus]MBM9536003.1 hypothetical protein [Desulfobulbus alkaliphilus]
MSKAKQRRAKKEQDKLWRAGRFMEWLVAVQAQPVTPELKRKIDQAWLEVQRRTLRTRQSFHEFRTSVDQIQLLPDTPELHFLQALKGFVEGDNDAGETIKTLTGLSGTYKVAQRSLSSVLLPPRSWQGIEAMLQRIARDPANITRKHYHELAGHLAEASMSRVFLHLGENMAEFRKLNHKANLRKPLSRSLLDNLEGANQEALMTMSYFPRELGRLVLLPFVCQVVLHLRQCSYAPTPHQVRELIGAVRGVFFEGCGDLLTPELRGQLINKGDRGGSGFDQKQMEADFSAASFEGKLVVLRDLRKAWHDTPSWGESDDPLAPDFFFDQDEDDDGVESLLLRCHRQVLKEIGRRLPALSPREGRALVAVIDPIVAEDVSRIFRKRRVSQAIIDVLSQAAESECMGIRLAMLAFFAAQERRNKRLTSAAIKALREGPAPGLDDIHWCLRMHKRPAAQSPAFLQVLFERIEGNDALTRLVGESIYKEVMSGVLFFSFLPFPEKKPGRTRDSYTDMMRFPPDLIRELLQLAAQVGEPLRALERFLTVFPQGRVNEELLRQWFTEIWDPEEGCTLFIAAVDELLECDEEADELIDYIFDLSPAGALAALSHELHYSRAILAFLKERVVDFRTLPQKSIETIVNEIYPLMENLPDYASLLIKTMNVLSNRIAAGETQYTGLRDELDWQLRLIVGPRGSRRKQSRGRKK